jgi:hypothetical protein
MLATLSNRPCGRPQPGDVGDGVMAAAFADATENVDRAYRKALEFGDTDEGPAATRRDGFCTGYFREIGGSEPDAFGIPRKQATHRARPWAAGQRISRGVNLRAMTIRAERVKQEAAGVVASDGPSA